MIFFDPNKQRVTAIAKEALEQVNNTGESPDLVIDKLAKAYRLNDHWKQRVVEEFNIQAFLQKLQEGTQHEQYQVAQPVIDECRQWVKVDWNTPIPETGGSKMEKTASIREQWYVEPDAFDYTDNPVAPSMPTVISGDNYDDSWELEKIAYERESLRKQQQEEELVKEASYYVTQAEENIIGQLIKIANVSPGFTKAIIYDLSKRADLYKYAEDILIGCKHKPEEVMEASIYDDVAPYEFEKLASVKTLIEELSYIIPLKKGIKAGKKKFVELGRKLKSNPINAIIPLIVGRGIKKVLTDDTGVKVGTNIEAFANE